MGGIALGKGVTTSGLLDVMDEIIRGIITDMSLYSVVLVLSGIVLVCFLTFYGAADQTHCFAGRINFHQPHDRQCVTSPHREGSREKPPRTSCQFAYLLDWVDLFHWNGDASFWVPKSNCVRTTSSERDPCSSDDRNQCYPRGRTWPAVFVQHRLPEEWSSREHRCGICEWSRQKLRRLFWV